MKNLKVSILLLSYNNFRYIFESLDSIFNQTYNCIQLIISDDGSKDFNANKLKRYIARKKKKNIVDIIINVNQENLGTVKHIEMLRKMAAGDLITSMAADDAYASSDVIQTLVEEYIKHDGKVKVITSLAVMCDSKLKKRYSVFTSKKDIDLINSGDSKRLFEELSYRCIMSASGTIVEKSIYDEIGSFVDDYEFIEDWSMHLRLARLGIRIICIDKITYLHREGGISHGNTRAERETFLRYYNDFLTLYLKEIEPYENLMSKYAADRARLYYESRKKRHELDIIANSKADCPKIVFYIRKHVAAKGDFSLYYRIAAYLAENYDYNVYCVNNSVPELQREYINTKIQFCDITSENIHEFEHATFVTAFNQLNCLLDEIESLKNAKILTLFLHPQLIDWMKIQFDKHFYNFDSIARMLKKNLAYGFQDEANLIAFERRTKIKVIPQYFPVVLNFNEGIRDFAIPRAIDNGKINFAWLGRLDKDKIYSLINFLDNLYDAVGEKRVMVHLIGDGNGKSLININKYAPKFTFVFNSYLYNEERDTYLRDNADFVVAMGVSALDVAALGIPTILPLVSSKPFREDKLVYLSDSVNYSIGWFVDDFKQVNCKWHSASKIIEDIYIENRKTELGETCRAFAVDTFSLDTNIDNIINLINGTTLTVKKVMHNPTFAFQWLFYNLYRKIIHKNADYLGYLAFREKYKGFSKLPLKEQYVKLKRKLNEKLKQYNQEKRQG